MLRIIGLQIEWAIVGRLKDSWPDPSLVVELTVLFASALVA